MSGREADTTGRAVETGGGGRPLNIVLNGEARAVPAGCTVADLLAGHAGPATARCAVEINREIVPRSRHAEQRLAEGDRVEVVTFVGGG